MRPRPNSCRLILALLLGGAGLAAQAAELGTLFTTPTERQIINSNRYQGDQDDVPPVQAEAEAPVPQYLRELVTSEYRISGITVSPDGSHSVWINSKLYEDGAVLEDRSRIKVIVGNDVRVRITSPDGKHYYATSGENLQVTFLAPLEN